MGQAGPPHLTAAPLHGGPRLVGRGGGEGLEEAVAQARHGGLREGREATQAAPGPPLLRRVPGDDPQPRETEGGHVEPPKALQRAVPSRPL